MPEKSIQEYLKDSQYRKNVGIVLYKKGKIFFAERSDIKGAWQLPQGGVDEDEDLLEAARRELFEETGLTKEQMELKALHPEWLVYTLPKKYQEPDFKGQIQKWFLFEFKDDDKNIDLEKATDKEFISWKWGSKEDILKAAIAFRKPIYESVFKQFSGYITPKK